MHIINDRAKSRKPNGNSKRAMKNNLIIQNATEFNEINVAIGKDCNEKSPQTSELIISTKNHGKFQV